MDRTSKMRKCCMQSPVIKKKKVLLDFFVLIEMHRVDGSEEHLKSLSRYTYLSESIQTGRWRARHERFES